MSWRSVYDWKAVDSEFARDCEAACGQGTETLEDGATRPASAGSDTLLIFLLKERDPKRFNQRTLVVGGDPNNPVTVDHTHHDAPSVVRIFRIPSNNRDEDGIEINGEAGDEGDGEDDDDGGEDEEARAV